MPHMLAPSSANCLTHTNGLRQHGHLPLTLPQQRLPGRWFQALLLFP